MCLVSCCGGREGERSVDVVIFLRAYKARVSRFNFVLCPHLSGVSWLPWGCEAENSLFSCAVPSSNPTGCPQPAVWFLSCLCCPPTLLNEGSSLGCRRAPSVQEGASVDTLRARCAAKSCLGGPAPLSKHLSLQRACSFQPGIQLKPGGSRACERELQASLAAVQVALCTLARTAAYMLT